ncbi:MAG: hypothetical protein ACLTVG_18885, partial [Coprococcus sp.]
VNRQIVKLNKGRRKPHCFRGYEEKDLLTNSLFHCLFLHVFLNSHKTAGKFGYSNRFYQPF